MKKHRHDENIMGLNTEHHSDVTLPNSLALVQNVPRVALHLEHLGMVRAKQHSPSPTNDSVSRVQRDNVEGNCSWKAHKFIECK
ncbi:uncharacterized protein [Physcomitrium patens]|uniref:uncharacterized protein isoform X3 n=1 Tax=Physcomitrium patens TaxID=3218 RepID=UPI003CCD1AB8